MAVELDPEQLRLRDELCRRVLPWIVDKALQTGEIEEGIERSELAPDALKDAVLAADHVVITTGPEFAALFRLAVGADGRIDQRRLAKELGRGEWPIRWGTFFETRTGRLKSDTLYAALSSWCTVVMRDGVVPEIRRAINAQISGEFSTTLRIGAVPGLRQATDISFSVHTRSTTRFLNAIARTHANGAIGLAGPRGSGKTTLIQRYVSGLHSSGPGSAPVAVCVSCPVNYDARDFVLHLHATLCRTVLERVDGSQRVRQRPHSAAILAAVKYVISAIVRLASGLVLAAAALLLAIPVDAARPILPQLSHPPAQFAWWTVPLQIVAACSFVLVASIALRVLRRLVSFLLSVSLSSAAALLRGLEWSAHPMNAGQHLAPAARQHLREIRMLQTSTTGWSGKITLPLGQGAAATKSIQLAERALTYPEVVDAFRGFIMRSVEVFGQLVIAIDEVDKIASVEQAQAFINDIKGIFGVPGCLYLVSISQDAVVTFERTGLGIRDAFDSAFDEIVSVDYLDLSDSLELLRSRVIGISEPFGFLCHCLSGGLPRELIRAVRRVAEHRTDREPTSLAAICHELVRDEMAARVHEFRIVANRLGAAHATLVLEPLVHLPHDASAKDLLNLASRLIRRQMSAAIPDALDRLRREAAMLAYHCATLKQVFTDELDENQVRLARKDAAFPGSFDKLAQARKAVAEDPHLAGILLDAFRDAWNLSIVPHH